MGGIFALASVATNELIDQLEQDMQATYETMSDATIKRIHDEGFAQDLPILAH